MTFRLPKRFARFADRLAASNPTAFPDAAAVRRTMADSYNRIQAPYIVGTGTGGYEFRKDGFGDIELWIRPEIAWPELDRKNGGRA
jgi:hypothetical protein